MAQTDLGHVVEQVASEVNIDSQGRGRASI